MKDFFERLRRQAFQWLLRCIAGLLQTKWFPRLLVVVLTPAAIAVVLSLILQDADTKALCDKRVSASTTDRDRALAQTLTFGTAGVGVILLVTIVTSRNYGEALWLAAACFSITVPFLVVRGMIYMAENDPRKLPPTVRQVVTTAACIGGAQIIFWFVGFAAFLWSYDIPVSILFVVGIIFAWIRFVRAGQVMQPSIDDAT